MLELKNLAKIVANRRLGVMPLLDFKAGSGERNREEKLLHLLTTEDNLTNLKVSKLLYGNASVASQAAVRKLKQRLHEKLLNHLFFLDHTDPRHPAVKRYELQCLSLLHQAGVLWREGERTIMVKILRKALRLAQEGEFTQHAVASLEQLRVVYLENNDYPKFKSVLRELDKVYKLLSLEREATQLYMTSKMDIMRSVAARRRLLQTLPETVNRMEELYKQTNSFNIYDMLLKLKLFERELQGDFEELVRITGEAEQLFAAGKINSKRFDSRFTKYYSLYAHLRAHKLHEGLALAEGYLLAFHPSSSNWFALLEFYFLLAMHAGNYTLAGELLQRAKQNPYMGKIVRPAMQRWELMRGYLYFIQPSEARLKPVHFAQLLQSIPDHSRDKRGYNVAILILQFLHYLQQGNLEALLPRIEGLRKYEGTHLRDAATLRSQLFFRLLQLTVKENFDPVACQRQGMALLTRLRATPPPGEAYAEIEIIPYESLWELTLDMLRTRATLEAAREARYESRVRQMA